MNDPRRPAIEATNEVRLIPVVRARLAKMLSEQGFRPREIAQALKVTQPAVAQYIKGSRGASVQNISNIDSLIAPLAEKLASRIRSGMGVEAVELIETAREILVMNSGRSYVSESTTETQRNKRLERLRARLRLELDAAERYLELANRTPDDYTKLLLRMIAADSIRHGDVVSQLMAWLEAGGKAEGSVPDEALLKSMLAIEDSAGEASLAGEVDHPVARLLLRWIDMDEAKHEKIVGALIALNGRKR